MSSIDEKTIEKVANLARIEIDPADVSYFADQIKGVVDWIEQLSEVDTDNVKPLAVVDETSITMREDDITDGGYMEDVTKNAPESAYGFYVVPKVVE